MSPILLENSQNIRQTGILGNEGDGYAALLGSCKGPRMAIAPQCPPGGTNGSGVSLGSAGFGSPDLGRFLPGCQHPPRTPQI